MKMTILLWWEN
jgi:hypothetical protein